MHEHLLKLENSLAFLQTPASDSGLAFGRVGGGDDDDSVTQTHQTHQTVSPQEPFYSVFTVLS